MRKCTRCGLEKPEEEFSWYDEGQGTRQYMCKECHKEMNRARYEEKKDEIQRVNEASNARRVEEAQRYIYEYLSYATCEDCGEYDFTVLTFHHVRGVKKMNIADGERSQIGSPMNRLTASFDRNDWRSSWVG